MPCDYKKYPNNWKTEIRPAILERAGNKCEFCGVENGTTVWRERKHRNRGESRSYSGLTRTKIVLTIAHLNHDVTDNRPENLRALCQKCHLNLDKDQHKATRAKNRLRGQADLFGEEDTGK